MMAIRILQTVWVVGLACIASFLAFPDHLADLRVLTLFAVLGVYGIAAIRLDSRVRWPWVVSILIPAAALILVAWDSLHFWHQVRRDPDYDPPLGYVFTYFSILVVGIPALILLVSLATQWRSVNAAFLGKSGRPAFTTKQD